MSNEAILINGSICLTDLVELAKKGHSAFTRGKKNNKAYVNFSMWINEEPDQHKNHASMLLNPSKEKRDADVAMFGKCYFGNGRKAKRSQGAPVGDTSDLNLDNPSIGGDGPAGDLPF